MKLLNSLDIPLIALAVVNCMVYVGYMILLTRDMTTEGDAPGADRAA